jgi:hypothetical protein
MVKGQLLFVNISCVWFFLQNYNQSLYLSIYDDYEEKQFTIMGVNFSKIGQEMTCVPGIIKNWPKEKHDLKEIMT